MTQECEKKDVKLPLNIFDFHAHLPGETVLYRFDWEECYASNYGEHKLEQLRKAQKRALTQFLLRRGFPIPDDSQPSPKEAAFRFAKAVDQYGLAGICFMTGGGNEVLAEAIRPWRKLYGFAHHDPFGQCAPSELEEALTKLELRGYKILATRLTRPLTSKTLRPLWEICEKYEIPVLIHFGPLGAGGGIAFGPNVNPLILHDIAKAYPKISFIIPHFGVGYIRELMQLMWACDNVLVDTSGSNQWRYYMWPQPTLPDLFRVFYKQFGATRIIFGTDSSHFPRGWVVDYALEQLDAADKAGIRESALEAIFRDNALRLLKLAYGT